MTDAVTAATPATAPCVLMVHDYPPVTGGGLALAVHDLAWALRGTESTILTSRLVDHFADDRTVVEPGSTTRRSTVLSALRAGRRADVVIVHWTFSFRRLATIGTVALPLTHASVICVVHTAPDHCRYNRLRRLPSWLRACLIRAMGRMLRRATATVALGRGHAEALRRANIEVTHTLPLPVAAVGYERAYESRSSSTAAPRRVGIVGELSLLKGTASLPGLLQALAPNIEFHIVGDGPLRPFVEQAIRALPERVRSAIHAGGPVPPSRMPLFYAGVDFILLASLTEAQCRVAIEAMLAGAIVLARPIEGLQDLVVDGVTGCHVVPEDPADIASTIRRIQRDPTLGSCLRTNARAFALRANQRNASAWSDFVNRLSARDIPVESPHPPGVAAQG